MEPKTGHSKSDHRARRCLLSGLEGDAINIILAAAAANLRKLLRSLRDAAGGFQFAMFRAPAHWPELDPSPRPFLLAAT
ncbi:MAG: hypothetical protein JXQ75_22315 [Phycisphaerae bacterium]|nr:hypothetical protein [Phycisphaerae bacterium]